MKATRHPFSLVEILLALGVVGIGICSVMVLFPVGVTANRDASMETYAAQAADQLLQMLEYRITIADDNKDPFGATSTDVLLRTIPGAKPNDTTDALDDTTKWTAMPPFEREIFYHTNGSAGTDGLFQFITVNTNSASDSVASDDIDYRGILKVWLTDKNDATDNAVGNHQVSALIHVQASWPAELPEAQRQKEEFSLLLTKTYTP